MRLLLLLLLFTLRCTASDDWPWSYLGIGASSESCGTVTLESLAKYMSIGKPESQKQYREKLVQEAWGYIEISESLLKELSSEHRFIVFHYQDTRPATAHGFGGVLVARNNCIEHAKVAYHDN